MILGITPARSGSKGIPGKNIRHINGKPLIAYTIEIALATPELDRYIISTDSESIANICKSLGADAPFLRPAELASDSAPMLPVLRHALLETEALYQETVNILVLLDPTAPLRTVKDVSNSIQLFKESDCNAVISVSEAARNPYFNMLEVRNGYCEIVKLHSPSIGRRQDAPTVFDMNTVVAVFSRDVIVHADNRIPTKTIPFVIPRERLIDLDTPEDLRLLESLLAKNS